MDRIDGQATVKAGVQIPIGAGEDDLFANDPSQRDGNRGRGAVPHARIANERDIGFQLFGVLGEKRRQRRRSGLLLALEQRGDMAGRGAELLEGAAGFEKGHELAFVVAGPARHDLFAMRSSLELRLERRGSPKIQRIDRLHVIVAVEQDARRFAASRRNTADDHRTSGGWTLRCLESEIAELCDQPIRGPLAIREMRGKSGNRRESTEKRTAGRARSFGQSRWRKERRQSWPSAPLVARRGDRIVYPTTAAGVRRPHFRLVNNCAAEDDRALRAGDVTYVNAAESAALSVETVSAEAEVVRRSGGRSRTAGRT